MNPVRLTTTTEAIDPIFIFIFGACLVLLIGITAVMAAFIVRYHRSRAPEPTSDTHSNLWLEIAWTLLPTLLVLAMFYYGWRGYLSLRTVPPGALEVTATARMWSWSFSYPDGITSPKLFVPAGRAVRVRLESKDVNHGFFIPAFRVKRDVIPGMANEVWFVADRPGSYDIFCSQYCGTGHAAMITTVEALAAADYDAWREKNEVREEQGGHEILEKHGCLGCHSEDGSPRAGPTFKGIWGRSVTVVTGGAERTLTVDEGYLKRAVSEPGADVVKGFPPIMPPFTLEEQEMKAVIGYLKGLK